MDALPCTSRSAAPSAPIARSSVVFIRKAGMEAFVSGLKQEVALRADRDDFSQARLRSIYMGGRHRLAAAQRRSSNGSWRPCARSFRGRSATSNARSNAEPTNKRRADYSRLREAGVNRVSIGAQTFVDPILKGAQPRAQRRPDDQDRGRSASRRNPDRASGPDVRASRADGRFSGIRTCASPLRSGCRTSPPTSSSSSRRRRSTGACSRIRRPGCRAASSCTRCGRPARKSSAAPASSATASPSGAVTAPAAPMSSATGRGATTWVSVLPPTAGTAAGSGENDVLLTRYGKRLATGELPVRAVEMTREQEAARDLAMGIVPVSRRARRHRRQARRPLRGRLRADDRAPGGSRAPLGRGTPPSASPTRVGCTRPMPCTRS